MSISSSVHILTDEELRDKEQRAFARGVERGRFEQAGDSSAERLANKAVEHASAPSGYKCSDCTTEDEACPTCYAAWWQKRHPGTILVRADDSELNKERVRSAELAWTLEETKDERDRWKDACRKAGVCMSCAVAMPEPIGCTDCLNTGWDGGAPIGFVSEELLAKQTKTPKKLEDR